MTVASAVCFAVVSGMVGGLIGWLAGKKSGFIEGTESLKNFLAFVVRHKDSFAIGDYDEGEEGADE